MNAKHHFSGYIRVSRDLQTESVSECAKIVEIADRRESIKTNYLNIFVYVRFSENLFVIYFV